MIPKTDSYNLYVKSNTYQYNAKKPWLQSQEKESYLFPVLKY